MANTVDVKPIGTGVNISDLNQNFDNLKEAINTKVVRINGQPGAPTEDGPNNMEVDLDMDLNRIINVEDGIDPKDAVNVSQLTDAVGKTLDTNRQYQFVVAPQDVFTLSAIFIGMEDVEELRVAIDGVMQNYTLGGGDNAYEVINNPGSPSGYSVLLSEEIGDNSLIEFFRSGTDKGVV